MHLRTLAAMTAAVLLAFACASPGPEPVPPTNYTAQVGEKVSIVENSPVFGLCAADVAVNRVTVTSGNEFDHPVYAQFVVADITVTGVRGTVDIVAGLFTLVAADGTVYQSSTTVSYGELNAQGTTAGQTVIGTVTFDTDAGAERGAQLVLHSLYADVPAGYWNLVGRDPGIPITMVVAPATGFEPATF